MFYAPWCGHCKTMKPDFAEAARRTSGNNRLGAVDCDVNRKIVEKFKIQGFPTILLLAYGNVVSTYEGPRNPNDLLKFVKDHEKDEL